MDSSRNCCEPPATSSVANNRPTSSKRSDSFCRRWRMDSFMAVAWGAAFSGMSAVCDRLRIARRLRRLYSPRVSMISCLRNSSPVLCASLLAASLLAGGAAVRPASRAAAPPTPGGDASALTVIAEVALKRGDCRAASEAYAHAATVAAAVQLARRATQVAMACEHLPAAWAAAGRWRALAPGDREADALYAAVALKLYHTTEARTAIRDYWRAEEHANSAGAGGTKPTRPDGSAGDRVPAPDPTPAAPRATQRTAKSMTELTALLLEESDAPAVLMAMSGRWSRRRAHPRRSHCWASWRWLRTTVSARKGTRSRRCNVTRRILPPCGCWRAPTSCVAMPRRRSPRRARRRRTMQRAAASSLRRFSPRSIATRRPTRSSSICAPAARRPQRSIGGSRCWRSHPGT